MRSFIERFSRSHYHTITLFNALQMRPFFERLPTGLPVTLSHYHTFNVLQMRPFIERLQAGLLVTVSKYHTVTLFNALQMRPFFKRLQAGLPVTVMALGDSITSDYGGCFHSSRCETMEDIMALRDSVTLDYRGCFSNSS